MEDQKLVKSITNWIYDYATEHNLQTLVVGVSGGIDSAVVSKLCALTGLPTIGLCMPIRQKPEQHDLAVDHCLSLLDHHNFHFDTIELTDVFNSFVDLFPTEDALADANSRARLRMTTLYRVAQTHNAIVVGTGNKIEDFGVGFFTKYGDGGVDISPLADLTKTEVWDLGRELGIMEDIINAEPTDGLWEDGRIDTHQLNGLSYPELEKAMAFDEQNTIPESDTDKENLELYQDIRKRNLHKMLPIPVFKK